MKTNILMNMKHFVKYICAVVLMLGMSISAWGEASVTFDKASLSGTGVLTGEDETLGTVTITGSDLYQHGTPYWSFDNISDEDHIAFYATPYAESFGTTSFSTSVTISYFADEEGTYTADLVVYYQDESGTSKTASIPLSVTIGSVSAPTLSHDASGKELTVSNITSTGATFSGGVVTNKGGADITKYGFTIGTSSTVVIGGEGANAPVASGLWNDDIALNTAFGSKTSVSNFSPNTTYYVRAFAYNGSVYGYSTAVQFKTIKQFTISLDGNGGSDGIAAVEENAAELIEITAPTRDHYTLEGYYTTSECDTKIANTAGELVASITVGVNDWTDGDGKWIRDAGETFYANWTPDNQTISFNANGGSGSMEAVVRGYNTVYALPACGFTAPEGKVFDGWAEGSAVGTVRSVGYEHTVTGNITFYATWRDGSYTDYVFSCAELTLTPKLVTAGTPIFITSAAGKTVRSQDTIQISGTGLTPSTTLTFPNLPSKFEIKKADGTALATNGSGAIEENAFIFYTPGEGDTSDGLDKLTGITVSVSGAKPITKNLTQDIIGRHLPADFVIAGKKDGKWYALPADFSEESTPAPIEIAVDDINNPGIAYTANTNIYNLYGQNSGGSGYLYNDGDGDGNPDGEKIKLGMKNNGNKPLFAFASPSNALKGDGTATVTNNIGKQYWWTLKQTNTSIDNPQDAKYTITSSNNPGTLSIKNSPFAWGTYKSGVEELRLIPASSVEYTESEVVAWGQKNLILEVALPTGATQARAKITDGSWSSNKSLATTTGTSVKGSATKYNYTLDFTDEIDFAANEGKMLIVELLNNEGTALRATSVLVPRIIAADRTINKTNDALKTPWNTEVHVLPGVTLTLDASGYSPQNMTMSEVNIYPGATVVVESGTLIATTLILRNGWNRLTGEKSYDVARLFLTSGAGSLTHTNAYSDWYIDYDQYYPVAVPFPVATSGISYKNTNSAATAGVRLRYYSGALRATNIQENQDQNWVEYTWGSTMPENLEPSHGYIMTARRPSGKAFSIVRMPMTFSNEWAALGEKGAVGETHKDTIYVKAWGDESTPWYAKGWNIIANPYMSLHEGALSYDDETEDVIEYANIPDIDFKEYSQFPIATTKLNPSCAFLVQAPKDGFVTFGATNRKASAPSFRREVQDEVLPTQKAYILLASDEAEDMMGILVSDKYNAEFEINADLEKLLGGGSSLRTYMHFNEMKMAYLAINPELAEQLIPVSVRITNAGEHTFSMHSASKVGELEGIYLIDYLTGEVTNLLEDSYPFSSEAGTISGRFAINAKVGERQTPTDLDIVEGDIHGNQPVKFIYRDKVYIWHNGVIYDTTGKKVKGEK